MKAIFTIRTHAMVRPYEKHKTNNYADESLKVLGPKIWNRPELLNKKGVLKNFAKFTGKYLSRSLFFNKVAGLRPGTRLLKKRFWHRCFLVNFANFLTTPFLTEQWLLPVIFLPILQLETSIFSKIILLRQKGYFMRFYSDLICF